MKVFAVDTNFVTPSILRNPRNPYKSTLDYLLYLRGKKLIEVMASKYVQAETYAILRMGRMKIRVPGEEKRVKLTFTHDQIMSEVERYHDLFDVNYVNNLESLIEHDTDYKEYKTRLVQEFTYLSGMSIKEARIYIEDYGIDLGPFKDIYDYHIMADLIQKEADFFISSNSEDFPNPLGLCRVIHPKQVFDHIRDLEL